MTAVCLPPTVGHRAGAGFNDAGQVAFRASPADGRNVIGLATSIPEPAAAGILIAAAFVTLRRRLSRPTRSTLPIG